jgi:hypothetical protein
LLLFLIAYCCCHAQAGLKQLRDYAGTIKQHDRV